MISMHMPTEEISALHAIVISIPIQKERIQSKTIILLDRISCFLTMRLGKRNKIHTRMTLPVRFPMNSQTNLFNPLPLHLILEIVHPMKSNCKTQVLLVWPLAKKQIKLLKYLRTTFSKSLKRLVNSSINTTTSVWTQSFQEMSSLQSLM